MMRAFQNLAWAAPLLFFLFLGRVLQKTQGSYHFEALLGTIACWAFCVGMLFFSGFKKAIAGLRPGRWLCTAAAVVLVTNALKLWDNPIIDSKSEPALYDWVVNFVTLGMALSMAVAIWVIYNLTSGKAERTGRWFWGLAGVTWAAFLMARILTPLAVRSPFIDCFTIATEAADFLLSGRNPYPQHFHDIYHGYYDYPSVLPYWPGVLYPETLARWLTGDVRYAFIAADFMTAIGLIGVLRRLRAPQPLWALVPLCWISFPVNLYVLQNSWVDSWLIGVGALVAWAAVARSWTWLGVGLGYFCGVKQYGFFLAIPMAIFIQVHGGTRTLIRTTGIALGVFVALLGPFVVLDGGAFFHSTLGMLAEIGIRRDALSIPAAFANEWGYTLPGFWMSLTYASALALACVWMGQARGRLSAWSGGLVLTYGATFLMGKQAFCNYYYLLAFFVLLSFIFRWEET